jgi:sulfate adenylyltransferase
MSSVLAPGGPQTGLAPPHGGRLVDLVVDPLRAAELRARAVGLPSWHLTHRQLCDLELLACGAFSPLRGFLGQRDHLAVCERMRLANGTLWPVPVCLDVDDLARSAAERCGGLALRDDTGRLVAVLAVQEAWRSDHRSEAEQVFGTADPGHPWVDHLVNVVHAWYLAGPLEVLALPGSRWPAGLRLTPRNLRKRFSDRGIERVVAFNTRNPMHRAHQELTLRAVRDTGAHLLIHPVVGPTQPGDIDPGTRVACYEQLLPSYPADGVTLAVLPLAMRMAGPREALWHAIIRQNFGATHMIIGRDHAGPRHPGSGRAFYQPSAAQELVARHADELRVSVLAYPELGYLPRTRSFVPVDEVPPGTEVRRISGTEVRRRLARGESLPEWFTPPSVAGVLARRFPPLSRRGVTVFLTGLSGAGKSTIAARLEARLQDLPGGRRVTLVDGDVARRQLSSELGYSRLDRDENVRRIGYLAGEVTKHGGVAVCAVIAPYCRARSEVRAMVEAYGGFLLVYVATPLEVCASRDPKGLYARARAGRLPGLTGVADPYEAPDDADLVLDTEASGPEAGADLIVARLVDLGYLAAGNAGG